MDGAGDTVSIAKIIRESVLVPMLSLGHFCFLI